jgi:hypothetical protein
MKINEYQSLAKILVKQQNKRRLMKRRRISCKQETKTEISHCELQNN